jgi:hypothetical protein
MNALIYPFLLAGDGAPIFDQIKHLSNFLKRFAYLICALVVAPTPGGETYAQSIKSTHFAASPIGSFSSPASVRPASLAMIGAVSRIITISDLVHLC